MENQQLLNGANIRKKWLNSFIAIMLLFSLDLILSIFVEADLREIVRSTIQISFWPFITYYCAYKKNGTKVLMLNLISIPLEQITLIATFFYTPSVDNALALFIYIPLFTWFWITSYRLRNLNLTQKPAKTCAVMPN